MNINKRSDPSLSVRQRSVRGPFAVRQRSVRGTSGFFEMFCLAPGLLGGEGFINLGNEPQNPWKQGIGRYIPFAILDSACMIGSEAAGLILKYFAGIFGFGFLEQFWASFWRSFSCHFGGHFGGRYNCV
jgi:hypothetical protein